MLEKNIFLAENTLQLKFTQEATYLLKRKIKKLKTFTKSERSCSQRNRVGIFPEHIITYYLISVFYFIKNECSRVHFMLFCFSIELK